ncbi:hypothetical protein P4S60_10465 [Pseudoalteromonas sp. Hal040]|uniref:hypothetical protein n=1 Tax=unclassified Pseudoalteromonas TaxID=194690 RepID=UPI00301B8A42
MSSTQEVSHSLKESLKDKVTHPLLGSFIISWFFFNWKAVYFMLFADIDSIYKLKTVSNNYSDIWLNLLYPLISALILGLALPWTTALFTRASARANEFYLNSQPLHYKKHCLTIEESNKLRDLYLIKDSETQSKLDEYRAELDKTIEECNSRINKIKDKYNKMYLLLAECKLAESLITSSLVPTQQLNLRILQHFFDNLSDGNSCYVILEKEISLPNYELRNAYEKLRSLGYLVDLADEEHDDAPVGITNEGIKYICDMKNQAINHSLN